MPETQLEKERCHEAGKKDLTIRKAMEVDCSWEGESGKLSEGGTGELCTGDAVKPIVLTPDKSDEHQDAMEEYSSDEENDDASSIADENDRVDACDLMDEAPMITESNINEEQWERLAREVKEDADMEDVAEEVILAEFKEVVKREREE